MTKWQTGDSELLHSSAFEVISIRNFRQKNDPKVVFLGNIKKLGESNYKIKLRRVRIDKISVSLIHRHQFLWLLF